MNTFDFDTIIDRRGTASLKWERYAGRDVLPLWVADMDFASPPAVVEALTKRVAHGVFGYTLPPAALVEAVREWLFDRFAWQIEPAWLVWLPGLVTGLNVACRAVGGAGDAVLTTVPIYPPFLSAPGFSARRLITSAMVEENGTWQLDFDSLERGITPETRLLLLCSPHNPTGRIFTKEELERLVAICEAHDLVLCSDEIHADLLLDTDRPHLPTATLGPEASRRTIMLMAPSKTFNIPGLGCSFAIIPEPQLRQRFERAMAGIVPYVNALGFTAALAAYRHGTPWLEALLCYLRANRDRVAEAVAGMPGLRVNRVEATYLAWLDARGCGHDDPARLFERYGVGLSDGAEFGAPGFVRLNFGCPRQTLDEALARMGAAL